MTENEKCNRADSACEAEPKFRNNQGAMKR